MPKIYELPASSTPENRSLVIEHTPGTAPGFGGRRQQRPQGSADPRRMLAGKMDMELNNVTQWFDSQVSVLDQGQLEPDKYKSEYAKLQRQAMNQRVAIQAKHQAAAQHIKNMQKLVEDRIMSPEQLQATMLVMAGVPSEHVRQAFAQVQRQKPSTRLNELDSMGKKLVAFRGQFEDYRGPHFWRGREKEKLYYIDPTGKKRKASETEREAYDATTTQIAALDREKQQIFSQLTPLEQVSRAGAQAVQRFGTRGGIPSLAGQRFGGVRIEEPAPKKKQPTAAELRKQGTREAYEKGIKLGYWE